MEAVAVFFDLICSLFYRKHGFMQKKLSIVMPAYNEERTIKGILDRIRAVELVGGMKKELIITNDCSNDDTVGSF